MVKYFILTIFFSILTLNIFSQSKLQTIQDCDGLIVEFIGYDDILLENKTFNWSINNTIDSITTDNYVYLNNKFLSTLNGNLSISLLLNDVQYSIQSVKYLNPIIPIVEIIHQSPCESDMFSTSGIYKVIEDSFIAQNGLECPIHTRIFNIYEPFGWMVIEVPSEIIGLNQFYCLDNINPTDFDNIYWTNGEVGYCVELDEPDIYTVVFEIDGCELRKSINYIEQEEITIKQQIFTDAEIIDSQIEDVNK
jgi:hypothetical protein